MSIARDMLLLLGLGMIAWGIAGWSRSAAIIFAGITLCSIPVSVAIKARDKQ